MAARDGRRGVASGFGAHEVFLGKVYLGKEEKKRINTEDTENTEGTECWKDENAKAWLNEAAGLVVHAGIDKMIGRI
jgi:hypothetical protein